MGRAPILGPTLVDAPGLSFQAITAGVYHTCGLTVNGDVYCWGDNRHGQLGPNAGAQEVPTPVPVGLQATTLVAGTWHMCALTATGAYCWGRNLSGQLGIGNRTSTATPTRVLGQP